VAWHDVLPWRTADGRAAAPRWLPTPAVAVYVIGSSMLFFAFGPRSGPTVADAPQWWWDLFAYRAEDLVHDIPLTLLHFATSVWANVHWLQYLYVTALLVTFGMWFERHEGSARTAAVFYATSIVSGIVAGAALLVLEASTGSAWWANEADRVWVGGSAGAYGLLGAIAARARQPAFLLALFVAWEIGLAAVYLHRATPLFHVTALVVGFAMARSWPFRRPRDAAA
jgi:hypothetical protein